jgi:hypothetical protein
MRQSVFIANVRQRVIQQRRQQGDLRFIRRILILVTILFITSFPYAAFFVATNTSRSSLPTFAHRMSYMFISFGQGMVMLLTVIYTDEVKKTILSKLVERFPCIRKTRVQDINAINIPL